jgi:hypothetical protein
LQVHENGVSAVQPEAADQETKRVEVEVWMQRFVAQGGQVMLAQVERMPEEKEVE